MNDTSPKLEQCLTIITIKFVLFDSIHAGSLSRPWVFQFKGCNRDSIDEDDHIDFLTRLIYRISHLTRHTKLIFLKILTYLFTRIGKGCHIEKIKMSLIHAEAIS